jgi:hypothetical protein
MTSRDLSRFVSLGPDAQLLLLFGDGQIALLGPEKYNMKEYVIFVY